MSSDEMVGRTPEAARPARRRNVLETQQMFDSDGYRNPLMFKPTCIPFNLLSPERGKANTNQCYGTTFRLLPEFNEQGEAYPARYRDGYSMRLSNFIDKFAVATLPGSKFERAKQYLVFDTAAPPPEGGAKPQLNNPLGWAIKAIKTAMEQKRGEIGWALLLNRGQDSLKYPNWQYFAYGLGYEHGPAERYLPPLGLRPEDTLPVVLKLGKQVGDAILKMVQLEKQDVATFDEEDAYVMRDPVNLSKGVLFRAYSLDGANPVERERARKNKNGAPVWILEAPVSSGEKQASYGYGTYAMIRADLPRYEIDGKEIYPRTEFTAAIPPELHSAIARRYAGSFVDHLIFPSYEQQFEWLIRSLREDDGSYMVSFFDYMANGYERWRPVIEDVLSHVGARTTVHTMPGAQGAADSQRVTARTEARGAAPAATDERRPPRRGEKPARVTPPQAYDDDDAAFDLLKAPAVTPPAPETPPADVAVEPTGEVAPFDDEDNGEDDLGAPAQAAAAGAAAEDDDGDDEPPAPSTAPPPRDRLNELRNRTARR